MKQNIPLQIEIQMLITGRKFFFMNFDILLKHAMFLILFYVDLLIAMSLFSGVPGPG